MSLASTTDSIVDAPEPSRSLDLELAVDPKAAIALLRDPAIAASRVARARTSTLRLVYYDSPNGALATAGLALTLDVQGRGAVQRLLRIRPLDGDCACPGRVPICLAERRLAVATPDLDALADSLPEALQGAGLSAIATAVGRRTTLDLTPEGMTATLIAGALQVVAAERPFARLMLSIPRAAATEGLALLRALAAEHPVTVSARTLAEEARALALNLPFEPYHRPALDLGADLSVEDAARHAIGHLTRTLLAAMPIAIEGSDAEGVHQTRVAIRRLRSVLTVFRPAIGCAEISSLKARLGELARSLGPARDWDVLLGGALADVAEVFAAHPSIADLRRAAEGARTEAYTSVRDTLTGPMARCLAIDLVASVVDPPWRRADVPDDEATSLRASPLQSFARTALARRYKPMKRDGRRFAELDVAALHALRIQAKRMRYTSDLFATVFDNGRRKRFHRSLVEIQDVLGHLNDSAVAARLMEALAPRRSVRPWAAGVLQGWVAARAETARAESAKAWAAFSDRAPFWED